jgi:hypothetical protein
MNATALPPLFALAPGPDGCTRFYQATLLQESPPSYGSGATDSPPIFLITPALLPQPQPAEAFAHTLPDFPPAAFRGEVLMVADQEEPPRPPPSHRAASRRAWGRDGYDDDYDYGVRYGGFDPTPRTDPLRPRRDVFYHGSVSLTRRTVLSFYCATAIPILEFDGVFRGPWPHAPDRVALYDTPPSIYRAWRHHWDPETWVPVSPPSVRSHGAGQEIPILFPAPTLPALPAVATTAAPPPLPPIAHRPGAAPSFVTDTLVRDALQHGATCPITLEPLASAAAISVTDCWHMFDATALSSWRLSGEDKCPICRTPL